MLHRAKAYPPMRWQIWEQFLCIQKMAARIHHICSTHTSIRYVLLAIQISFVRLIRLQGVEQGNSREGWSQVETHLSKLDNKRIRSIKEDMDTLLVFVRDSDKRRYSGCSFWHSTSRQGYFPQCLLPLTSNRTKAYNKIPMYYPPNSFSISLNQFTTSASLSKATLSIRLNPS